ncbi:MAG TPA: 50S ribosomal protein L9 [Firmicutes bacterium]|nr:50S ribosomal protein L9 [Bacillota bacterium]
MKILMIKDLKKVGKKGEVVNVSDGYGANYIIPQGYGKLFNEEALRNYKKEQQDEADRQEKLKQEALVIKEKLDKVTLEFEASCGRNGYMIGQISLKQIENELNKLGYNVDKKKFVKAEPVTYFGTGEMKIELYKGVVSTIHIHVKEKTR